MRIKEWWIDGKAKNQIYNFQILYLISPKYKSNKGVARATAKMSHS